MTENPLKAALAHIGDAVQAVEGATAAVVHEVAGVASAVAPIAAVIPGGQEVAAVAGVVTTVDHLLATRGKTYGAFVDNATIAQAIKQIVEASPNWQKLRPDQQEAIHQIASKLSRILTGNDVLYVDNWDDIAGYATLVANAIRPDSEAAPTVTSNRAAPAA